MATRLAALAVIVFFLATAFRSGWRRAETDFPNYYTAALSMRKGLPVRDYYDWTWFQRQMNYAGIEQQLGGYQPQTPLTALPLVPLSYFPVQTAKRIWLLLNLGFLALTVWLLVEITGFRAGQITLVAFLGFGSLYSNFLYGQYYVFLLFLMTATFYFLDRGKLRASGFVAGMALGLKLYGGPLLLYFAVKKNGKAVAGFIAAIVCALTLAVAVFGWGDTHYYGTQILPRSLAGEIIDPYNSGNGTLATLLRRLFVPEPELNPQPVWNAPMVFFFLRPFLSLMVLGVTLVGIVKGRAVSQRRDFAWFVIATLLLSVNTASYSFILLLLPVTLLLVDAELTEKLFLLAWFCALCFPLRPGWSVVFPKLWILIVLFLVVGRPYLRLLSPKLLAGMAVGALLLASVNAWRNGASYRKEPGQRWERVATEKNAIFSSSPAVSRAGLFYQSIGSDRYILRWAHDGRIEELPFDGHAFNPTATSPEGTIHFELVAHGASTNMAFDPITKLVTPVTSGGPTSPTLSVVSPNRRWVAFESSQNGPRQIWLRNVASGAEERLTGGDCNSFSPAWELDSKAIIFASDCGRGIGLPSLYRAKISGP
jgi:Glycosyltransferase family 87